MLCHPERSEGSRTGTENYTARDFARFFANAQNDTVLWKICCPEIDEEPKVFLIVPKVSVVDWNVQWMSRFSTDTRCRWGVGAFFYWVNDFYFWPGTEQRSAFLEQSTFVSIQIALYFQKFSRVWKNIFTLVKKYFQQSENLIWIEVYWNKLTD